MAPILVDLLMQAMVGAAAGAVLHFSIAPDAIEGLRATPISLARPAQIQLCWASDTDTVDGVDAAPTRNDGLGRAA